MTDLAQATARLRRLTKLSPSGRLWSEVRAALASKWEGVQSVACEVLACWGGKAAVQELRAHLTRCSDRKAGWASRGVVVGSLARVVGPGDADWVLDLYFTTRGVLRKHELLPLVFALDPGRARARLIAESASTDRDNRQAAMKAFCNMPYPVAARIAALHRFERDSDKEIRRGAKLILDRLRSGG